MWPWSPASAAPTVRPNVLFLWVDDLGYGDVGALGNNTIRTPHIDALAATGATLTAHLVASPLCTPSRAALLTGRHAVRTGLTSAKPNFNVMGLGPGGLPPEEVTLAEALRDRGYSTHMVGKWHLGVFRHALPTAHGFGSYWGMPATNVQACKPGRVEYPHDTLLEFMLTRNPTDKVFAAAAVVALTPHALGASRLARVAAAALAAATFGAVYIFTSTLTLLNPRSCMLFDGETVVEQPVQLSYLTHRATARAKTVVATAPRPFFLYMSYHKVHTALFTADEFAGVSAHGEYGDNVEELDWSVGQIMGALEAAGDAKDTLVYFASDNGPFREEGHESGSCGYAPVLPEGTALVDRADRPLTRASMPLRGAKAQTWDCGLRVPGILAYPARWPGGRAVHAATSALDLLPTVLRLAGAGDTLRFARDLAPGEHAGPGVLDGRDLTPLLDGTGADVDVKYFGAEPHDFLFHYCAAAVSAVRHGRWKAHFTTSVWDDGDDEQTCKRNVICNCHGHVHEPPLLFDMYRDPAELAPLDAAAPEHAAVVAAIRAAKARHEASVAPVPSQTERLPSKLTDLPCCGVGAEGSWAHAWAVLTNGCGC